LLANPKLWGTIGSLALGGLGGKGGGGGGKKGGDDNATKRAQQAYSAGSPRVFKKRVKMFEPYFQRMLRPGLQRTTDAASMGAETLMQGFGSDVARRGLSGSGADLFGRQGIRSARQASISDATVRFYETALANAMGQANQSQALQVGALTGTPVAAQGGNPYQGLYDTGENLLAGWLLNQGNKAGGVPGLQNPYGFQPRGGGSTYYG
jgi:hypothetical protein